MKKIIIIASVITIIFTLSGCKSNQESSERKRIVRSFEERLDKYISLMSLEEKIAQMLIVYDKNEKMSDELYAEIKDYSPGGYIMQTDNFTSYDSTLQYINRLKAVSKIPMFISIDQEGGNVQRLNNLWDVKPTYIPNMFSLGSTEDTSLSYDVGTVMANELRTIGVNMDFAPVLDIYTNPKNTVIGDRAFGSDADRVIKMAFPLGEGLSDSGIIPVYKHFPGHGDTEIDSHFGLPIVDKTLSQLEEEEIKPFVVAIKNNVPIIMVAHIAYPNITGDNTPASLSYKMVTEILKEKMGYQGIVVSDGLDMDALVNNYSYKQIYEMAINAGVDILLMPEGVKKAVVTIKESINEGIISTDKIDESVKKILTLKFSRLYDYTTLDRDVLGSKENQEIIDKIK